MKFKKGDIVCIPSSGYVFKFLKTPIINGMYKCIRIHDNYVAYWGFIGARLATEEEIARALAEKN